MVEGVFLQDHFLENLKPYVRSMSLSLVSWGGVKLSPLGTSATIWPIVPAPDDG
jgi:hypothetical protein